MNIPFLDLDAAVAELRDGIDSAVARVLSSHQFVLGEEVERFEQAWAAFCGAEHAIGVGSGLDALFLALHALGIGPGDEVIVPSHTFIATWLAVSHLGALPVPVEPRTDTCNLDPEGLERAITRRTRAIVPVHLYGQSAELDPILAVARRNGLLVVEDAAQAHGARYRGRRIGAHADAVAWSFYPGKNLGAVGDAGAVTTRHSEVALRIRKLRNYGSTRKYIHDCRGFNSRMDPMQAAVLGVKLEHLDRWNQHRSALAARYSERLREVADDVGLHLPVVHPHATPVWHLYTVRHPLRDQLLELLRNAGIETLVHYPIPPHRQAAYAAMQLPRGALPRAEILADSIMSLPIGPHLPLADVDRVADALLDALRQTADAGAP